MIEGLYDMSKKEMFDELRSSYRAVVALVDEMGALISALRPICLAEDREELS